MTAGIVYEKRFLECSRFLSLKLSENKMQNYEVKSIEVFVMEIICLIAQEFKIIPSKTIKSKVSFQYHPEQHKEYLSCYIPQEHKINLGGKYSHQL